MPATRRTILPEIALFFVPFLWGWGYPLIRESMTEVGPLTFLFYRFTVALIPLLILFRKHLKKVDKNVWKEGILVGIALFAGYGFLNWGLIYTPTAKAGFVIGLRVILVPLIGASLFRSSIALNSWIGAGLSVVGLIFIFFSRSQTIDAVNRGDIIMLFCTASFAVHILLIGRYSNFRNFAPNLITQISVVTVLSGIGMLLFEGRELPTGAMVWENIVITGLFSTALAFWLQTRFQFKSTANRTGIIFSGEPLFAALFGYIYLQETLVGWQWLGAFFIVVAILMIQLPALRRNIRMNP